MYHLCKDLIVFLCFSGQFISSRIQSVCAVLKPQTTPEEFLFAPNPLLLLLSTWQELPSIFLQADSSDNSCFFFIVFCLGFFFFVARRATSPSPTPSVLSCLSLTWNQRRKKRQESLWHETLESTALNWGVGLKQNTMWAGRTETDLPVWSSTLQTFFPSESHHSVYELPVIRPVQTRFHSAPRLWFPLFSSNVLLIELLEHYCKKVLLFLNTKSSTNYTTMFM